MAKEEIKQKIISILLDAKQPYTLAQLAEKSGVSSRSIRNYLNEIQQSGLLGELTLIKKPSVGIYLEQNEIGRIELKRRLNMVHRNVDNWSPESRQQNILKTLFKNRYTYTIQLLADDLYVSKSTIVKDLVYVQKWLEKHGLKLKRKPNQGLWIEGDEYIFRRAMMDLFSEVRNVESEINEQEIENLDYRIDFINFNKIKQLFPKIDLSKIQTILQQAEKKLGYCFTDEAFINLIIHIAITMERVKHQKEISMEKAQLEKLTHNYEFQVAQWVVDKITEAFGLQIPVAEVGYISLHMLGARVQQNIKINNFEAVLESENKEFVELAKKIIRVVSEILGVDLTKDKLLLTGLALHLRPTVMRIRYGMKLRNPLLERIKREYTSIFGAAWASSSIFEKMFGITINEEEVGHIAMHIGAAVERLKRKVKTVVVCASGVGTSQLVTGRLERELPELEIVEIIPVNHLDKQLIEGVDLIISTVSMREKNEKVVHISTLADQKDIANIRNFIEKLHQDAKKDLHHNVLKKTVSEDFCFVNVDLKNKQEIIKVYGTLLEKKGYARSGFVESALRREEITSTSVGKGIAIPHGNDEFVIKPKICVIKLKEPIDWDEGQVDLVFLLALKFQNGKVTKSFFRTFYSILDNQEILQKIRSANSEQEIIGIILGEDGK